MEGMSWPTPWDDFSHFGNENPSAQVQRHPDIPCKPCSQTEAQGLAKPMLIEEQQQPSDSRPPNTP